MRAIDNVTGSVLVGEVRGDQFIVQDGPDFDPHFEVYGMDEVTVEEVDFPTELDNDFSDADMFARAMIAERIARHA